jgi:hypothetical protein
VISWGVFHYSTLVRKAAEVSAQNRPNSIYTMA